MAMRITQPLRALRMSKAIRGHEPITAFSERGMWSTFTFRQRYTVFLKLQTDPTLADYFFEKCIGAWCNDVPSYNYWFVSSAAVGLALGITSRHMLFNPDIYWRKQEAKKPFPDRHRQFCYALPFFNHRLRNIARKYRWTMIDNEPDWIDEHPLGYRPQGQQTWGHRCFLGWQFTVPMYRFEDPLATSVTHKNFKKIYEECGYVKPSHGKMKTMTNE